MQPPYGMMADLLLRGQVIPFLGAGVHLGSRAPGTRFDPKDPTVLPSGGELSDILARASSFPEQADHAREDLPRVSAFFSDAVGRSPLRDKLHEIFDRTFDPAPIHDLLAQLARRRPLLIVTTNYDDLMEVALEAAQLPYDLVYYPTDREDMKAAVFCWRHGAAGPESIAWNRLLLDLERRTVVYKMHGTVVTARRMPGAALQVRLACDSYVITEDDYVEFLARMADKKAIPQQFLAHFRGRHFQFAGYGLGDWNLRVLLRSLPNVLSADKRGKTPDKDIKSWAIQSRPSEEAQIVWRKRLVNIYDVDINVFAAELRRELGLDPSATGATTPATPEAGTRPQEPDHGP